MIPKHIFREYDIRGLVNKELTPKSVLAIAKAVGAFFVRNRCTGGAVGHDNRESSTWMEQAVVEGLSFCGVNVVRVGMVPTPVQYFAMHSLNLDCGVQITGSHNPPEYNGMKITMHGLSLFGEDIREIGKMAAAGFVERRKGAHMEEQDVTGDYLAYIRENVRPARKLKVVVDAGNGMGSELGPRIFQNLGCDVVPLYCEYDSSFPNHLPDPSVPDNMRDLARTTVEARADLGVAFDGDCDRIGIVDEKGRIYHGDELLLLLAHDVLRENPGAKVIFDVKCSELLEEFVNQWGGVPIRWKTGHSLIKTKLKQEGALLAGEMSGHMYLSDRYFGYDDALYTAARVAEIVSRLPGPLSDFFNRFPAKASTPELRIPCDDAHKFGIVERLKSAFPEAKSILTIDGVRAAFDKGWALIRASNTQPVLVLRFEADDEETLARLQAMVEEKLKAFPEVSP